MWICPLRNPTSVPVPFRQPEAAAPVPNVGCPRSGNAAERPQLAFKPLYGSRRLQDGVRTPHFDRSASKHSGAPLGARAHAPDNPHRPPSGGSRLAAPRVLQLEEPLAVPSSPRMPVRFVVSYVVVSNGLYNMVLEGRQEGSAAAVRLPVPMTFLQQSLWEAQDLSGGGGVTGSAAGVTPTAAHPAPPSEVTAVAAAGLGAPTGEAAAGAALHQAGGAGPPGAGNLSREQRQDLDCRTPFAARPSAALQTGGGGLLGPTAAAAAAASRALEPPDPPAEPTPQPQLLEPGLNTLDQAAAETALPQPAPADLPPAVASTQDAAGEGHADGGSPASGGGLLSPLSRHRDPPVSGLLASFRPTTLVRRSETVRVQLGPSGHQQQQQQQQRRGKPQGKQRGPNGRLKGGQQPLSNASADASTSYPTLVPSPRPSGLADPPPWPPGAPTSPRRANQQAPGAELPPLLRLLRAAGPAPALRRLWSAGPGQGQGADTSLRLRLRRNLGRDGTSSAPPVFNPTLVVSRAGAKSVRPRHDAGEAGIAGGMLGAGAEAGTGGASGGAGGERWGWQLAAAGAVEAGRGDGGGSRGGAAAAAGAELRGRESPRRESDVPAALLKILWNANPVELARRVARATRRGRPKHRPAGHMTQRLDPQAPHWTRRSGTGSAPSPSAAGAAAGRPPARPEATVRQAGAGAAVEQVPCAASSQPPVPVLHSVTAVVQSGDVQAQVVAAVAAVPAPAAIPRLPAPPTVPASAVEAPQLPATARPPAGVRLPEPPHVESPAAQAPHVTRRPAAVPTVPSRHQPRSTSISPDDPPPPPPSPQAALAAALTSCPDLAALSSALHEHSEELGPEALAAACRTVVALVQAASGKPAARAPAWCGSDPPPLYMHREQSALELAQRAYELGARRAKGAAAAAAAAAAAGAGAGLEGGGRDYDRAEYEEAAMAGRRLVGRLARRVAAAAAEVAAEHTSGRTAVAEGEAGGGGELEVVPEVDGVVVQTWLQVAAAAAAAPQVVEAALAVVWAYAQLAESEDVLDLGLVQLGGGHWAIRPDRQQADPPPQQEHAAHPRSEEAVGAPPAASARRLLRPWIAPQRRQPQLQPQQEPGAVRVAAPADPTRDQGGGDGGDRAQPGGGSAAAAAAAPVAVSFRDVMRLLWQVVLEGCWAGRQQQQRAAAVAAGLGGQSGCRRGEERRRWALWALWAAVKGDPSLVPAVVAAVAGPPGCSEPLAPAPPPTAAAASALEASLAMSVAAPGSSSPDPCAVGGGDGEWGQLRQVSPGELVTVLWACGRHAEWLTALEDKLEDCRLRRRWRQREHYVMQWRRRQARGVAAVAAAALRRLSKHVVVRMSPYSLDCQRRDLGEDDGPRDLPWPLLTLQRHHCGTTGGGAGGSHLGSDDSANSSCSSSSANSSCSSSSANSSCSSSSANSSSTKNTSISNRSRSSSSSNAQIVSRGGFGWSLQPPQLQLSRLDLVTALAAVKAAVQLPGGLGVEEAEVLVLARAAIFHPDLQLSDLTVVLELIHSWPQQPTSPPPQPPQWDAAGIPAEPETPAPAHTPAPAGAAATGSSASIPAVLALGLVLYPPPSNSSAQAAPPALSAVGTPPSVVRGAVLLELEAMVLRLLAGLAPQRSLHLLGPRAPSQPRMARAYRKPVSLWLRPQQLQGPKLGRGPQLSRGGAGGVAEPAAGGDSGSSGGVGDSGVGVAAEAGPRWRAVRALRLRLGRRHHLMPYRLRWKYGIDWLEGQLAAADGSALGAAGGGLSSNSGPGAGVVGGEACRTPSEPVFDTATSTSTSTQPAAPARAPTSLELQLHDQMLLYNSPVVQRHTTADFLNLLWALGGARQGAQQRRPGAAAWGTRATTKLPSPPATAGGLLLRAVSAPSPRPATVRYVLNALALRWLLKGVESADVSALLAALQRLGWLPRAAVPVMVTAWRPFLLLAPAAVSDTALAGVAQVLGQMVSHEGPRRRTRTGKWGPPRPHAAPHLEARLTAPMPWPKLRLFWAAVMGITGDRLLDGGLQMRLAPGRGRVLGTEARWGAAAAGRPAALATATAGSGGVPPPPPRQHPQGMGVRSPLPDAVTAHGVSIATLIRMLWSCGQQGARSPRFMELACRALLPVLPVLPPAAVGSLAWGLGLPRYVEPRMCGGLLALLRRWLTEGLGEQRSWTAACHVAWALLRLRHLGPSAPELCDLLEQLGSRVQPRELHRRGWEVAASRAGRRAPRGFKGFNGEEGPLRVAGRDRQEQEQRRKQQDRAWEGKGAGRLNGPLAAAAGRGRSAAAAGLPVNPRALAALLWAIHEAGASGSSSGGSSSSTGSSSSSNSGIRWGSGGRGDGGGAVGGLTGRPPTLVARPVAAVSLLEQRPMLFRNVSAFLAGHLADLPPSAILQLLQIMAFSNSPARLRCPVLLDALCHVLERQSRRLLRSPEQVRLVLEAFRRLGWWSPAVVDELSARLQELSGSLPHDDNPHHPHQYQQDPLEQEEGPSLRTQKGY